MVSIEYFQFIFLRGNSWKSSFFNFPSFSRQPNRKLEETNYNKLHRHGKHKKLNEQFETRTLQSAKKKLQKLTERDREVHTCNFRTTGANLRARNGEGGRGSGFDFTAAEGAAGGVIFGEEERDAENLKRKSVRRERKTTEFPILLRGEWITGSDSAQK